MKILCVLFAFMSVVHLTNNRASYRIDRPINDFIRGKYISAQLYCADNGPNCQMWAMLDYLTLNDPKGLSCYLPLITVESRLAYVYGTKLQNRIWNFQEDKIQMPDAYLFLDLVNGKKIGFTYLDAAITPEKMLLRPDYLFIRKDYFMNFQKKKLLEGLNC